MTSTITTNLFFDLIDFQADNVTIKISTSPKGTTLLDSVLSEFVIVVPLPTKQEQEEQQPNVTEATGPKSLALTMTSTANEIVLDTKVVMNYGDIGHMTIVMAGGNIDVWNSGVAHFPHSTTTHPRDALLHCESLKNSSSSSSSSNLHRTPACKAAVIHWNQLTMPSNTQGTLQLLTTLVSHDGTGKLLGQVSAAILVLLPRVNDGAGNTCWYYVLLRTTTYYYVLLRTARGVT